MASKDIPGLVFTQVHLGPPASSFLFFHQQIPTSPALVDFNHLIEGTLPGDQRPLTWQMTHDRRLCRSAEGKPVTLRGLGQFLERTYISCKVNIDGPEPQAHGRISKHGCRAGSGAPMLPALSSEPLSACSLRGNSPSYAFHPPLAGGYMQQGLYRLAFSHQPVTSREMGMWKGWVFLTYSLWATYIPG